MGNKLEKSLSQVSNHVLKGQYHGCQVDVVNTVYCAFLCAMELDVNNELISTRQNHRFLSNNYISQQMNRNEFLKTIRLTSFQKPTIITKNKIV